MFQEGSSPRADPEEWANANEQVGAAIIQKRGRQEKIKGKVVVGSDTPATRGSFVGAMKLSSNTAEMQAKVGTLLFPFIPNRLRGASDPAQRSHRHPLGLEI